MSCRCSLSAPRRPADRPRLKLQSAAAGWLCCLLWAALTPAWGAQEHTEILSRSAWPAYANGASVLALPQVRAIVEKFEEHARLSVEIRYPGGDAGRLWAEAVLSWLVAFGIPRQYLTLQPGAGAADRLVLALIDRRQGVSPTRVNDDKPQ